MTTLGGTLLLLLHLGVAAPAWAQSPEQVVLAVDFDLDGEAADPDQVVQQDALVDSQALTIVGQPDVCRALDVTVEDANASIVSGTVTIAGTDCLGDALEARYTFDGTGDGVFPLEVTAGAASGPYFRTVTQVVTDVLDGEGRTDTVSVGYSADCPLQYVLYGARKEVRARGDWQTSRDVNPFGEYVERRLITTSGALSTRLTASGSDGAFTDVAVGDRLLFTVESTMHIVHVTEKSSSNEVTIDRPVLIQDKGVDFRWQKRFVSADPGDGLWIPMVGYGAVAFLVDQDAEASTGDTVVVVECRAGAADIRVHQEVLDGDAATLGEIDLARTRFDECRLALGFGQGDDDDAGADESLNITLLGNVR